MKETDPTGRESGDPGAKMDGGKLQAGILEEVFPHALEAVAKVCDYGARKYSRGGCLQVPDAWTRYKDAEWRHRLARAKGETHDEESGLPHEAHEAWNVLMCLELLLRGRK